MTNKIIIIIIVIIVAAGGFFAGMKYQQSQRATLAQGAAGAGGFRQRFGGQGGQNGQAVRGQVISTDNGTMTIKMRDGSTKLVVLSTSTNITHAATGSKEDLKAGEQVMVFGSNNSDGSV